LIPGGLFELAVAFWLLIKGFNPEAYAKGFQPEAYGGSAEEQVVMTPTVRPAPAKL
jgi:hypothetical protein